MTRIETELLAALFLIYAYDCVHWIGPEDRAFTRSSTRDWKSHQRGPLSFTLLGKTPLLVDPLLLFPGYIRIKSSSPAPDRALRKVSKQLNRLWITEMQCRIQAMLLLLFLPWIIWTHRLLYFWQELSAILLCSHLLLMLSFFLALRRNSIARPMSFAAPMLLNPLGATRLLEVLSQGIFDKETSSMKTSAAKTPAKT